MPHSGDGMLFALYRSEAFWCFIMYIHLYINGGIRLRFKKHSDIRMIMFSNYCCHQSTSYRIMGVALLSSICSRHPVICSNVVVTIVLLLSAVAFYSARVYLVQ